VDQGTHKGEHFIGGPGREDATFIAAARTDVPLLLAELRRLRARLADLERARNGHA
jgi:hypothetical protein